jgi:hypothetical protein
MNIRTGHLNVLRAVGLRFAVCVDLDGSYQGSEAAVVVKDDWSSYLNADDPIGLVIVGYGSCSGCDEWEAIGDGDPVGKLNAVLRVYSEIKWFDNLAELQAHVAGAPAGEDSWSSDHALQWYGHSNGFEDFQQRVAALRDNDLLVGDDD